jgi:hypothetical protein
MSKEPRPNFSEIGSNLERLEDLLAERKRELDEKLYVMGNLLVPLSDPDNRYENLRLTTEKALHRLPQKGAVVGELITKYGITTHIDDVFLSEMLLLSDRFLETSSDKRDEMFEKHEKEIVIRSVESLKLRRLSERMDREGEMEHAVEVSSNRTFRFFLSEDTGRVRMDIPVVIDPYDYKVAIGMDAVDQILGDKLTMDDYTKIAETLLALPGKAGKVARAYAQSIDTWAQLYSVQLPSEEAREIRKLRSYDVRKVFGDEDPRVSPFCDIPLNSIYMHVVKNYPEIKLEHIPQPFES